MSARYAWAHGADDPRAAQPASQHDAAPVGYPELCAVQIVVRGDDRDLALGRVARTADADHRRRGQRRRGRRGRHENGDCGSDQEPSVRCTPPNLRVAVTNS